MSRTIEQIFKNSYHVGAHYGRFRILLVTEGGPDFSGSTGENAAVFRVKKSASLCLNPLP